MKIKQTYQSKTTKFESILENEFALCQNKIINQRYSGYQTQINFLDL